METLVGLLESRARRTPSRAAVAIHAGDRAEQWTWEQYWSEARSAGAGLRTAGVSPGDHVLMLLPDVREAVRGLTVAIDISRTAPLNQCRPDP